MDLPMATAVTRLKDVAGYREAFAKAFPKEGLTESTMLKAIATFERTIVTGDTPFDRWIRGDDKALSDSEPARLRAVHRQGQLRGLPHRLELHRRQASTTSACPPRTRGGWSSAGAAADQHAFKTPSLREIAPRAPYMHHGQLRRWRRWSRTTSAAASEARLAVAADEAAVDDAQDVQDLVAFMRSLSSPQTALAMPNLPSH
jgi:cytochrome c peroxidase